MDDKHAPGSLTEAKASQLLERAAKLDAQSGGRVSVEELREVALEAGISAESFEQALAEIRTSDAGASTRAVVVGPSGPPAPDGKRRNSLLATLLQRTGLLAGGSVLTILSQTLISDVGMDSEPVMVFTFVVAALMLAWSAMTKRRDRKLLDFEVDVGVLWTAMTFWLMLTNPGDVGDVLEVMMPAGLLAGLVGGLVVSSGPAEPQPEQLPEST